MDDAPKTNRSALIAVIVSVTALATLLVVQFDQDDQLIFLVSYASGVGIILFKSGQVCKKFGGAT